MAKGTKKKKPLPARKANAAPKEARPSEAITQEPDEIPAPAGIPVVGIGASAGGLEAFSELLRYLSVDTGMAFVFIQHLDPTHPSHLVELLSKKTSLSVLPIQDGTKVEANKVYILPPHENATIHGGVLRLTQFSGTGKQMPIDVFFRSLAESEKGRAIGIVLSGTASDGTLGLKAIKAEDGITFAQDERSAKYDGMPRSAEAAGCVDFILPPKEIAEELAKLGRHPYVNPVKSPPRSAVSALANEEELGQVFRILKSTTGVDFTYYKHPTIHRRILRRMVLRQKHDLRSYVKEIQESRDEAQALYQDLLISVTGFFRDSEAFDLLKKKVFPELTKDRLPDQPIRIWVPGCSTGEEAYSIAISLVEYIQQLPVAIPAQIFATDISDQAIEKARTGIYPKNISLDISPERLRRFFTSVDRGYQVAPAIREMCVFARQNLIKDPPFSRLDLISCRNVLIYLGATLQKSIMSVFHYALAPSGYLLLGASETVGLLSDLFAVVDKKQKLYQRKSGGLRPLLELPSLEPGYERANAGGKTEDPWGMFELQKETERIIMSRYTPPGVLVNEDWKILQFHGKTGFYLEPSPGEASLNVLKMAREGLTLDLRAALHNAKRRNAPMRKEGVRVRSNGDVRHVNLEVVPIRSPSKERHFLVVFEDVTPAPQAENKNKEGSPAAAKRADRELPKLREELAATRQYLQSIIEEQEATNEELKSATEEIQSSNEELQSTNEELETAKEELQSTNEELTTVNEELQNRNLELTLLNNDLSNLLASVSIPLVMLGLDLRIRRFTPMAEKVLNLIPTDVGRHIMDIRPNINVPDVETMFHNCLETLSIQEREVQDRSGRWYTMWIRPYKTAENKIEGAVLALVDIDALRRAYDEAQASREYAQAIVETIREPLLVLDERLQVKSANRSYYQIFRAAASDVEGRSLFEVGGGQWNIPALREALDPVINSGSRFQDLEIEQELPALGQRTILFSGRPIGGVSDSGKLVLLSMDDVTDRKQTAEARYRRLFEAARDGIIIADAETGRITDVNPYVVEWLGFARSDLTGRRFWQIAAFADPEGMELLFREFSRKNEVRFNTVPVRAAGGKMAEVEIVANVYTEGGRRVIQLNLRDVTERRRNEEQIKTSLKEKETLLRELHHRVKNNLQTIASLVRLQSKYAPQKEARMMLGELSTRLRSLSSIHDLLYRTETLEELQTGEYLERLCVDLFRSYAVHPDRVVLKVQVDPAVHLSLDRAVTCGLIVNELVSNALKHGFAEERTGEIEVALKRGDGAQLELRVSNNGAGLPAEFDPEKDGTLGLQLVKLLAAQLQGTFAAQQGDRTEFRVNFPTRKNG